MSEGSGWRCKNIVVAQIQLLEILQTIEIRLPEEADGIMTEIQYLHPPSWPEATVPDGRNCGVSYPDYFQVAEFKEYPTDGEIIGRIWWGDDNQYVRIDVHFGDGDDLHVPA